MKRKTKRIVCGAMSLVMASALIVEGALQIYAENAALRAEAGVSFKDVTGKYDTSKLMQENFNASVLENKAPTYETRTVVVELESDAIAKRADGAAVSAYLDTWEGDRAAAEIAAEQNAFLKALSKTGIPFEHEKSYNTVMNGVAIEIDTKYVSTIKNMKGVEAAYITSAFSEPETVETKSSGVVTNETEVYATGIYDSSKYTEEYGSGKVVAVLDTGLDYTHPAFQRFQTEGMTGAWSREDVANKLAAKDLVAESRSGALDVSDVYMNDKVPYAYDYADSDADVYPSYSNHGTHVAGIIGGYDTTGYTDKDGNQIDETFKGVVPDAQLAIFKVFTDDLDSKDLGGALPEDIIAALEDCVKLGVDVINMSLGTSCGFSTTDDGDPEGEMLDKVYKSIQNAGISLICAASNDYSAGYGGVYGTNLASNPDSGTVGSPSTFAGALSVASINGQKAGYMIANEGTEGQSYVFFEESRDIDGNPFDFVDGLVSAYGKNEFEYVVVGGVGLGSDYALVENLFKDKTGNPRIALISRGDSTFQEKVEIAMKKGAAGVIIYNNVAGVIRMNLGEIDNPIPAVSVNMNAGLSLVSAAGRDLVGKIKIDKSQTAGPFMSEFSSWGPTHDLKIKPEITAHGGEITSTVPGGYGEQSGTSMASPNMAGFMAVVRSYVEKNADKLNAKTAQEVNQRAMQLTMSTAGMVYDQDGLLYSPRKQGAGVAKLDHVIDGTQAYLWTESVQNDNRPKVELLSDVDKTGEYTIEFKVTNFGDKALTFRPNHEAMTETLSKDGLTVSEQARMLDKATSVWAVNGTKLADGDKITIAAGDVAAISVTLTLDKSEKQYIDASFKNGMYVEGFMQLQSETDGQCDLSLPFLGFYGDWKAAPMLDYSAFEVAENKQDASVPDEEKIKASVWETLPYTSYYNEKYILPMGGYVYLLDEYDDPVYVDEEHCSVSCYNDMNGTAEETDDYFTSTAIKAVYAGLLRNARIAKYRLYDEATGEQLSIFDPETGKYMQEGILYRIGKAYTGGGSGVPSNVEINLDPLEQALAANGRYRMEFEFFQEEPAPGEKAKEENTFSFSFTVDYEAPILEDVRVRYYNYKQDNKDKQRIYLDVDVYDNHYPQAVMLCYPTVDADGETVLQLATDYPVPVRDAERNSKTTVSIEITDIYKAYGDKQLYLQIDDFALNSCLYELNLAKANATVLPEGNQFALAEGEENLTLDIYQTHKVSIEFADSYVGSGDLSNFKWKSSNPTIADVKNGEIVGLRAGSTKITFSNGKGATGTINVKVTSNKSKLPSEPAISFGVIETDSLSIKKAQGSVKVHAGKRFTLDIETDPWYHPMTDLRVRYSSSNEAVATVNAETGEVLTIKKGTAIITATVERKKGDGWEKTLYSANVSLRVQNEFTVSNYMLTDYNGLGYNKEIDVDGDGTLEKVLEIPTDMNIWYIGEEAFQDNDNVEVVIIPKSVTQISERAFEGCTKLREVYFVSTEHREYVENGEVKVNDAIDFSDLSMVYEQAFANCPALEKVDLSNVKTITLDRETFANCPKLKEVVDMPSIGTMHDYAFANTALTSVDLSGLHMSGKYVFSGVNSITEIKTGRFTAIGDYMFAGCKGLTEVTLSTPKIGASAFYGCTNLKKVTLDSKGEDVVFAIGDRAFENCASGEFTVDFHGEKVRAIGNRAFAGTGLKNVQLNLSGLEVLGESVFAGTDLTSVEIGDGIDFEAMQINGAPFKDLTVKVAAGSTKYAVQDGVIYNGDFTKVLFVNDAGSTHTLKNTVTEILPYAFANAACTEITLSANLTKIGKYAFYNANIEKINFNGAPITAIEEGTFRGTKLTEVEIPDTVKSIGDYAFASSLLTSFTGGNGLDTLGNNVFDSCKGLQKIALPDGIKRMGDRVFANCGALTEVTLPSVEELGNATFNGATSLNKVTFGAQATTTGTYTFGGQDFKRTDGGWAMQDWYAPITEVIFLGNGIETIGMGTFYACKELTKITLPDSVKTVGAYAFYGCGALTDVENIENVATFEAYAFYNTALTELQLDSAVRIAEMAFAAQGDNDGGEETKYTVLTMPIVEEIGAFAFLNNSLTSVSLPATVKEIGAGAFASAAKLSTVNVAAGNTQFFAENNVLYRNLATNGGYELVLYPAAATAVNEYVMKEGTVSVLAYAFYGLNNKTVKKVVMPYSLKTIGDSAFYASGITEYTFESIVAPTLENEYRESIVNNVKAVSTVSYYRGYFYTNFQTYLFNFTHYVGEKSPLIIHYPTNGKGYDTHIYKLYFGTRNTTGIQMEDNTRACVTMINAWASAETVRGWPKNAEITKEDVVAFSEEVKTARLYYNNAQDNSDQAAFLKDVTAKLLAVEEALREIKPFYNIKISIKSVVVDSTCTYKSVYNEGETFDITGLRAIVEYDDYSKETINTAQLTLVTKSPLTKYTRSVEVKYGDQTLSVDVKVQAAEEETEDTENEEGSENEEDSSADSSVAEEKGCGGCGGTIHGVTALALLAAGAALVLKKKKE